MKSPLPVGETIGIIGGGQLGRMLAMAAARLGYRTVILEPQADCPAAQLANRQIIAAYDDPGALDELARSSSVVTYEFENVPVASAAQTGQNQLRSVRRLPRSRSRRTGSPKSASSTRPEYPQPVILLWTTIGSRGGAGHARRRRRAEDPPAGLRRQGPARVQECRGRGRRRRLGGNGRRAAHPGIVRAFRARDLGDCRARARWRGPGLRPCRKRASRRHPAFLDGAGGDFAGDCRQARGPPPSPSWRRFPMSASSASSSSSWPTARWSPTRSRPGCTTPATGRKRPARSRSSSSTSAPSPACRSAKPRATRTASWKT